MAGLPAPWMRFETSIDVGGLPAGTMTVGALPKVPAGEGEATGAKVVGVVGVVVADDATVVVVDFAAVVVVVGVELPEKA